MMGLALFFRDERRYSKLLKRVLVCCGGCSGWRMNLETSIVSA